MHSTHTCIRTAAVMALFAMVAASPPRAQAQDSNARVDTLVAHALAANPALRAARARVDAAQARIAPAGALPDPMLMAGIQNLPVGKEAAAGHGAAAGPDPMTMRMVGVGQTIPYPGKLSLSRRIAERELDATRAALVAVSRQVERDVKDAYYELAFLDRALEIVQRNQSVLVNLIRVTETRYGVGTAGQQDVLKARVEATRLAETAVSLTEQRHAALARLNAVLDQPTATPLAATTIPLGIARAAVPDSGAEIRFVSGALGARASDSPLPPIADLQEAAIRNNPELREHEAMIAAQTARVELARKAALPAFDISVQYGQRDRRPDMVTAMVSIPIPVQKGRKQDQLVRDARAELAARNAEHDAMENELRAEVARLVSDLERQRAQLALYVKAIVPQGRAALASATASYQVGRVEFLTVLDNQATLFTYETEYFRGLTDFARTLAELERIIGEEVLR